MKLPFRLPGVRFSQLAGHVRVGLGVFGVFFLVFVLSTSREHPWNDAKPIFEAAGTFVERGDFDVPTRWPYTAPPGRNGKWYAAASLLPSMVHVPGIWVYRKVTPRWPHGWFTFKTLSCHVGPAAMGAFTCLLFLAMCRQRGLTMAGTTVSTLLLGFASIVWVYARSPFTEVTQMACFTGFFAWLLLVWDRPTARHAAVLGLWAGLLINSKVSYLLSLPGAALLLAWRLRGDWRALVRVALAASVGVALGVAVVLWYNWVRWGSLTEHGYAVESGSVFRESLAVGFFGMLLSPGKSIFLYCPIMVLSIVGFARVLRLQPHIAVALALTAGPPLAVHAKTIWWSGDWAWGPRYLVFAVPALLLPAAMVIDRLVVNRQRLKLAAVGVLGLAGVVVQLLGNAFYWDHYIRVAQDARSGWLGVPNRSGGIPWNNAHACDPCFEDLNPFIWLPPFQPILGHWWMLGHVLKEHDWVRAEADAPWHRYTKLQVNIADAYARARIDWWYLDFRDRFPQAGRKVLGTMAGGALLSGALWWWGARAGRRRGSVQSA